MEIVIICLIFLSIVIFIFFKLQNNKLQDKNLDLQQKNQEQENKTVILEKKNYLLSSYVGRFEQLEITNKESKEENKHLVNQRNLYP